MKYRTPLIAVCFATACGGAMAAEYGNVIASTGVMGQVAIPQQSCGDVTQIARPQTSGGGAMAGALLGGVVGNSIGGGAGRVVATGPAAVAGAILGDRAEAANSPAVETAMRNCQTVTYYENRITGYDVTYEYRGQRYSERFAQDPGARVALKVSVSPAGEAVNPPLASTLVVAVPTVVSSIYVPVIGYSPYAPYGYYGYDSYGGPAVAVYPRFGTSVGRRRGF